MKPRASSSSSFAISDITGLIAHYDASDASSLTTTGSDVTAWADQTGTYDLTDSSGNRPALETTPDRVRFLGGGYLDGLTLPSFQGFFLVAMRTTGESLNGVVHDGSNLHVFMYGDDVDDSSAISFDGNGAEEGRYARNSSTFGDYGENPANTSSDGLQVGTLAIYICEYENAQTFLSSAGIMGNSSTLQGLEVAEIGFLSGQWQGTDAADTVTFLANKWSVTV